MSARLPSLFSVLVLVAFACAPAGPSAARRAAGDVGLLQELRAVGRVEYVAPEGPLARAAELAAARLGEDYELAVGAGAGEGGRAARVVLATLVTPGIGPLLERLGIEVVGEEGARGIGWRGYELRESHDALVAVLEDPERPGLPVTLVLGNDPASLAGLAQHVRPAWRPSIRLYRGGLPEVEARLTRRGGLRQGTLRELAGASSALRSSFGVVENDLPHVRIVAAGEPDPRQVASYLTALGETRARVVAWLPEWSELEPREARVAIALTTSTEDHARLAARDRLFTLIPSGALVKALLQPGMPDDGGAGLALAMTKRVLGEPAAPWLEDGVAYWASERFFGQGLEVWGAWLTVAGVRPGIEDVLGARPGVPARNAHSPLATRPLRGLLFRWLVEQRGEAQVRAVWSGEAQVTAQDGADFRAWLDALSEDYRAAFERRRQSKREAPSARRPWRGAVLRASYAPELGEDHVLSLDEGFGSHEAVKALLDLHELGANAVLLSTEAVVRRPVDELARLEATPAFGPRAGDLLLAGTMSHARAIGLRVAYAPDLILTRSGTMMGRLTWPDREAWRAFYELYADHLVHHALLAELCGVQLFCIGSSLLESMQTGTGKDSVIQDWKRESLPGLIARVRAVYTGELTYAAGWPSELEHVEQWDQLDYVGVNLLTGVNDAQRPSVRPDDVYGEDRLRGALHELATFGEEQDRPVLLMQVGFPSVARAWRDPVHGGGATDPAEQRRLYGILKRALQKGLREPLQGFFLWYWSTDPEAGGSDDRGFLPQGKPAVNELAEMFGG